MINLPYHIMTNFKLATRIRNSESADPFIGPSVTPGTKSTSTHSSLQGELSIINDPAVSPLTTETIFGGDIVDTDEEQMIGHQERLLLHRQLKSTRI